jgi:hypothetical protein
VDEAEIDHLIDLCERLFTHAELILEAGLCRYSLTLALGRVIEESLFSLFDQIARLEFK